jgi:hypothetical protein
MRTKRCLSCERSLDSTLPKQQKYCNLACRTKKWNEKNPRDNRLFSLKVYGLDYEKYNTMLDKQNGVCDICKRVPVKPVIDHCHKTNKVRGIICNTCNSGIGMLKDDLKIIKNAVKYLEKYEQ